MFIVHFTSGLQTFNPFFLKNISFLDCSFLLSPSCLVRLRRGEGALSRSSYPMHIKTPPTTAEAAIGGGRKQEPRDEARSWSSVFNCATSDFLY